MQVKLKLQRMFMVPKTVNQNTVSSTLFNAINIRKKNIKTLKTFSQHILENIARI